MAGPQTELHTVGSTNQPHQCHQTSILPKPPQGGRSGTTSALLFWALLSDHQTFCLRKLQEKLRRDSRPNLSVSSLLPPRPPSGARAAVMPAQCSQTASPLRPNNADFHQESSQRNHPSSPSLRRLWLQAQAHIKKGGFGIRDPVLHSIHPFWPQAAAQPSFAAVFGLTITTLQTPMCPLQRRNSDATSEKMQLADQMARHTLRVTNLCDVHTLDNLTEQSTQEDPLAGRTQLFSGTPTMSAPRRPNLGHDAIFDVFHQAGQEAGIRPQKEKAGLLQPRPDRRSSTSGQP